jgi:maltose O-acetyltransferase
MLINRLNYRFKLLILKLIQKIRIYFFKLVSTANVKGCPTLSQPLHAVGSGVIQFEGTVNVGIFPSPYFLSSYAYMEARNLGSSIFIGDGSFLNNGFTAIAEFSDIYIGRRVLVGTNVEIFDSNFHGLEVDQRNITNRDQSKSVTIGDDVFLGSNVKISKGVTIGRGSIIANGSIVVKNVPEFTIAGGNPAVILGMLKNDN